MDFSRSESEFGPKLPICANYPENFRPILTLIGYFFQDVDEVFERDKKFSKKNNNFFTQNSTGFHFVKKNF